MTTKDALKIAQEFHETYERLAPAFGYETRADTKTFDPESRNGRLMAAVCLAVCGPLELAAFRAGFDRGLCEKGNP
jgi:hypothetical protein